MYLDDTVLRKADCIIFDENGADLPQFLGIAIGKETREKVEKMLSIRNEEKIVLSALLLDRWMLYQEGSDSIYVRHVASDRQNVLYQIILSGQEWDGIYELALKGHKIRLKGYIVDGQKILMIESPGNYNLADFSKKGFDPPLICRANYSSDEAFKEALLRTQLITEEDLEIYYKPDETVKPYLDRMLPKIILR